MQLLRLLAVFAAIIVLAFGDPSDYKLRAERSVVSIMRDGVKLRADVYRPDSEGSFPVLLGRTPYGKQICCVVIAERLARRGYIVVIQDVRGRGESEGNFDPFFDDESDGFDSVEWAAQLPKSSGKVGMILSSYGGATQILAALAAPPHLVSIFVLEPAIAFGIHQIFFEGGAFRQLWSESWAALLAPDSFAREMRRLASDRDLLERLMRVPPLGNFMEHLWQQLVAAGAGSYFREWVRNPPGSPYWERVNLANRVSDIKVPGCYIAGWYDVFGPATEALFDAIQRRGGSEIARTRSQLIIGPWNHGMGNQGDADFGKDAAFDVERYQNEWFDYWLKGKKTGAGEKPAARVFATGENRWVDLTRWRVPRMKTRRLYLSTDVSGTRSLNASNQSGNSHDLLVSDPAAPVPTTGGKLCCHAGFPGGAYNQTPLQRRPDVLVYDTGPIPTAITSAGEPALVLSVSLDTPDADLIVKLIDVFPGSEKAINIADGALRLRYRDSMALPQPIQTGQIYQVKILLGPMAHTFLAGHRIGVQISSSDFPNYSVNSNSGEEVSQAARTNVAHITIHHDPEHESYLELPHLPPHNGTGPTLADFPLW